jgi:predicted MFS family arabinose efflux permease
MAEAQQAADTATLKPAKGAWPVLAILCFVYVLNFLDRQLLSILAKPIQDELGVTDGQLGLIGGLYFALFYCILAIPVGWLADRTNRTRVLAFACGLWSAATMACGLAANYPQLVLARMTVGVGEAGGVPPSYAIISDYFPPGRRGTALGLFNLGPPIGQALGVAFGAAIAATYSWRMAFLVIGAVGVVTAFVVLFGVREPERGGLDRAAGAPPKVAVGRDVGFWPTVRMFFTTPALLLMALASAATQVITYGAGNFTVLFLMREKGMTLPDVSLWYALVVIFGMGGGIFASGRVIDRFTRTSKVAFATVPAASLALAVAPFLAFVWAPSWPLALVFLLFPTFLNYFYLSSAVTLVQEEVAPEQRVLSGALLLLVMNLIGMGLGPTFVGLVSDAVRPDYPDHSLQMAFYALTPLYALAIGLFLVLARVLKRRETATA